MNAHESATKRQWSALIVDDDNFVRDVMADMLKTIGAYKIYPTSNVKDAVMTLAGTRPAPDLILCDLHMPGKDGFQFMEELAAQQYAGGVILISGQQNHVLHSATLMARFHQLNILAALEKPITLEQLRNALIKLTASLRA